MNSFFKYSLICLLLLFTTVFPVDAQWNGLDQIRRAHTENYDSETIRSVERRQRQKDQVVNVPLENSLLWEISGNGLKKPSYLFGTIHMICDRDFVWLPYMQRALERTDELILEIDMNEVEEEYGNVYGTMIEYEDEDDDFDDYNFDFDEEEGDSGMSRKGVGARYQDGKNSGMPKRAMARDGVETADFRYYNGEQKYSDRNRKIKKPDGAYSGSMVIEDCNKMLSYEGKLTIFARERNMKLSGLETIEEQLNIDDVTPDNYERRSNKKFRDLLDTDPLLYLSQVYLTQNLNDLMDLLMMPDFGINNLDRYLFDRNQNWVRKLPALMQESPKFIAVGAGHLPGDKGVIHLLRKKGYTVKPVLK